MLCQIQHEVEQSCVRLCELLSDNGVLVQVAAAQSLHLAWSLLPRATSLSLLLGELMCIDVAVSKVAFLQGRSPVWRC